MTDFPPFSLRIRYCFFIAGKKEKIPMRSIKIISDCGSNVECNYLVISLHQTLLRNF